MSESAIGGAIFIVVGAAGVAVGIILLLRTRRFVRESVTAQGVVTGLIEGSGSEGGTVYQRVVQFTTAEGRSIEFTERTASSPAPNQPGDAIPVRYRASNPEKAKIGTRSALWFWPAFPILLGLIFVGSGVFWLMSADGSEAPEGGAIPSASIPATTIPPTLDPSAGATGGSTVLSVVGPSGPATATATCDHVVDRNGGSVREYQLRLDGSATVVMTADPYSGPGTYLPGSSASIGGTFFGDAPGAFSGAVIVDASGQSGTINVVASGLSVSGTWNCANVDVDQG